MGLQFFWGCPWTPRKLPEDPHGSADHRLKTPALVYWCQTNQQSKTHMIPTKGICKHISLFADVLDQFLTGEKESDAHNYHKINTVCKMPQSNVTEATVTVISIHIIKQVIQLTQQISLTTQKQTFQNRGADYLF